MPLQPEKDFKQFYSISEVAEMLNVTQAMLRYWEKEFTHISPKKNARGVRLYTKEDIEKIRVVYNLVKVRGYRIEAARDVLRTNYKAASDTAEVVERLLSIKRELQSIKRELGNLE